MGIAFCSEITEASVLYLKSLLRSIQLILREHTMLILSPSSIILSIYPHKFLHLALWFDVGAWGFRANVHILRN